MFSLAQIALPTPPPPPVLPMPPAPSARPVSRQVVEPQDVRPLPGGLDAVPVFNSNSPELIQTEGILLSTFPPDGMRVPSAHLDHPFEGRFDVFAHHVARGLTPDDTRTLYLGFVVYNPDRRRSVELNSLHGASYLSQEAPFLDLPSYVANPLGTVFSGPGSRTMNDVLRGQRQPHLPATLTIRPRQLELLLNVPIPLRRLTVPTDGTWLPGRIIPTPRPPEAPDDENGVDSEESNAGETPMPLPALIRPPVPDNRPLPTNGRSLLMHLTSDGPVYIASLAMYAPKTLDGDERVPTLAEWQRILQYGGLAGPRDYPPTPPDASYFSRFFYGRVAGVAQGSQWVAQLTDSPDSDRLTIPNRGDQISYVLSTVDHNTMGTGQIQSAPMLTRYPDTAYRSHGNYGIKYDLSLPLYNPTDEFQTVAVLLQTPLQNESLQDELAFLNPPPDRVFFRGTVKLQYRDDWTIPQTRYFHIVQRQGQQGEPLIRLRIPPGDRRLVRVEFIYPPDATPPQVLTVETLPGR